jgi:uncharacterized protein
VAELLLLEQPIRVLCGDDCLGLCPTSGANLNKGACACGKRPPDPRLAALGKLGQ